MKRIISIVVITAMMLVILPVYADEPELKKARCTAYILKGTMANGEQTRLGCAAFTREAIGKSVVVYLRHEDGTLGRCLGIFECTDVCPTAPNVLDIWMPDMDSAQQWMDLLYSEGNARGRIYYQLIDAKG